MTRAILPELIIALFLLLMCGLILIGISAAATLGITARARRIQQWRHRQVAQRHMLACQRAPWEAHTDYRRGYAVITLRRVARWDGQEEVTEIEDRSPVILPEDDPHAIGLAQIEAELRAAQRNGQLRQ